MYTNFWDILSTTLARYGLSFNDLNKVKAETKKVIKKDFLKTAEINLCFDESAGIINDISYNRRLAKAERFINNRIDMQ